MFTSQDKAWMPYYKCYKKTLKLRKNQINMQQCDNQNSLWDQFDTMCICWHQIPTWSATTITTRYAEFTEPRAETLAAQVQDNYTSKDNYLDHLDYNKRPSTGMSHSTENGSRTKKCHDHPLSINSTILLATHKKMAAIILLCKSS